MARTVSSPNRCCTAAENRCSSAPIAVSAVMPRPQRRTGLLVRRRRQCRHGRLCLHSELRDRRGIRSELGFHTLPISLRDPRLGRRDALQAGRDRCGSPFRHGALGLRLGPGEEPDPAAQFPELGRVLRDAGRGAGPALALHHLVKLHLGRVRIAIGSAQVVRQRLALLLHGTVLRHGRGDAGRHPARGRGCRALPRST